MVDRSTSPVPHWTEGLASWMAVQMAKGKHPGQGSILHHSLSRGGEVAVLTIWGAGGSLAVLVTKTPSSREGREWQCRDAASQV